MRAVDLDPRELWFGRHEGTQHRAVDVCRVASLQSHRALALRVQINLAIGREYELFAAVVSQKCKNIGGSEQYPRTVLQWDDIVGVAAAVRRFGKR
jgi:hypothetical protein